MQTVWLLSCGYVANGSSEDQEAIDAILWSNGFQPFFTLTYSKKYILHARPNTHEQAHIQRFV